MDHVATCSTCNARGPLTREAYGWHPKDMGG